MTDIQTLREELEGQSPRSILKTALKKYDNIAISFSGAEDVVLIEMAHKLLRHWPSAWVCDKTRLTSVNFVPGLAIN